MPNNFAAFERQKKNMNFIRAFFLLVGSNGPKTFEMSGEFENGRSVGPGENLTFLSIWLDEQKSIIRI